MWVVDLLLVVPSFILIAIVTPRTKNSANIMLLVLLLPASGWMISSRMVRGMTMSLREREFIRAASYGCLQPPDHRRPCGAQRRIHS